MIGWSRISSSKFDASFFWREKKGHAYHHSARTNDWDSPIRLGREPITFPETGVGGFSDLDLQHPCNGGNTSDER